MRINLGEKKTVEDAYKKAVDQSDWYNADRYVHIISRMNDGKDITMAEYMDARLYLGLSVD